jgi:3-oxoacyl-[acyl-carrier protein] reductase
MKDEKVILITGGGTGIGRETALRFAREGVHAAINYSRSVTEAEQTREDVESLGARGFCVKANVANDREVRDMVDAVIQEFGRIDILVNSAGTTDFVRHADLEGLKDEFWDRAFNVNVKGLFHSCRAVAGELRKRKGCIINITSLGGMTGLGSSIAYAASKAAAISVTRSLARVMAPEVRVNSLAPGIVLTRWVDGHQDHIDRGGGIPLERHATPQDVAETAWGVWANCPFITGQNIVIDGGRFIGV